MIHVRKRKLREDGSERSFWKKASPQERLEAVETINGLNKAHYAEQAFPRIHRVTRKTKR